jgi:hypothetical protein
MVLQPPERRHAIPSEVAPGFLLPLDGLEQRLEVSLAEAQRAVPLDELEEDRRAVADGLVKICSR